MAIQAAIFGASGYTGQELIRILSGHPQVNLVAVTSRRYAGRPATEIYPSLSGMTTLTYSNATPQEISNLCDVAFLALPHGVSMDIVPVFINAGRQVIDLSADYRMRDLAVYEKWYAKHSSADLFGQAVYGLPELYRNEIKQARLIANPGCYPTAEEG